MAEFSEVMRQWRRMCKHSDCESCEIIDKHAIHPCDKSMDELSEDDLQQIECIVMRWAAEHPEPVYPTWGEWLLANRIIGDADSDYAVGLLMRCKRISADIAQKLGIEPKEE